MIKEFDLNRFKMGYVLAYKSNGSFFSEMIVNKQYQEGYPLKQSQIVHIEISGGRRHSINIAPPISKLVDITKKHKGQYVYLLKYKNKHYEEKGRYKVAYFSATLCNRGYDIPGILRFLFKWIKQSNRLWFCSEGALWSLQKVYPETLNGSDPSQCMPADFLNNKWFNITWEGIIP